MKSYEDLVQRYENATGLKLNVFEADNGDVSESCLAAVMPDGRIRVWKDIDSRIKPQDKEEALAHEMMHKILNTQILCFEPNEKRVLEVTGWNYEDNFDEVDYELTKLELLSLEINNALSHKTLINELMDYNIESKRHISDRLGVLEDYKVSLSSELATKETPHCIGLILYDLEQTVPGISEKISAIVSDNIEVFRAYSLANEFFIRITTGANLENQEEAVKQFLTSLKYDPNLFAVNKNLII